MFPFCFRCEIFNFCVGETVFVIEGFVGEEFLETLNFGGGDAVDVAVGGVLVEGGVVFREERRGGGGRSTAAALTRDLAS